MPIKPEQKPSDHKHETKHEERDTKRILSGIHDIKGFLANIKANPETDKSGEALEHKRNRKPLWITAGITFVYAVVSIAQWQALRSANEFNRKALESVQRAFVFFDTGEPKSAFANGEVATEFIFKAINSGTTPTKNLRMHVSFSYGDSPTPDPTFPDYWEPGLPHTYNRTVLGPKSDFDLFGQPIPNRMIVAIRDEGKHMFYWGWAEYWDVFDDTLKHLTEFCYELHVTRGAEVPPPPAGTHNVNLGWDHCEHYNCYDEECADYKERATTERIPR